MLKSTHRTFVLETAVNEYAACPSKVCASGVGTWKSDSGQCVLLFVEAQAFPKVHQSHAWEVSHASSVSCYDHLAGGENRFEVSRESAARKIRARNSQSSLVTIQGIHFFPKIQVHPLVRSSNHKQWGHFYRISVHELCDQSCQHGSKGWQ